jgi:hypothetical protein
MSLQYTCKVINIGNVVVILLHLKAKCVLLFQLTSVCECSL